MPNSPPLDDPDDHDDLDDSAFDDSQGENDPTPSLPDMRPNDSQIISFLTVVQMMCIQQAGKREPFGLDSRYTAELNTNQQPFLREIVIGPQWQAIDHCWLDQVALLVIRNDEGQFTIRPTDEERRRINDLVVEVCFVKPVTKKVTMYSEKQPAPLADVFIMPGRFASFMPRSLGCILLRSPTGPARCTIAASPF